MAPEFVDKVRNHDPVFIFAAGSRERELFCSRPGFVSSTWRIRICLIVFELGAVVGAVGKFQDSNLSG